ncbi:hypothetical protein [Paenibacillus sp. NPDC058071]|uniref:hypothetical protein n=1 Tax=Paenibacillus sp. NPDC058071 TaxID=3346326 RepID=UPI0036DE9CF4
MAYSFRIEPAEYTAFEDETEQIDKCKEWGLLSEKAVKTKVFYYKGHGLNETCSIIGYADDYTAVIAFENGDKHSVHPSYLKEMQASGFGARSGAVAVEAAETPAAGEAPVSAEAGAATAADGPIEGSAISEGVSAASGETADIAQEKKTSQADLESATLSDSDPAPAETASKAKAKPKKEKAPKLQLPEEKVKMIATVKEFTTVPNHFTEGEDEVIVYEGARLIDTETEVGDIWSSHSATMKKLELEVGDTISFEAKIVAKKLTKHPVPYKINNPSKIQKQ